MMMTCRHWNELQYVLMDLLCAIAIAIAVIHKVDFPFDVVQE